MSDYKQKFFTELASYFSNDLKTSKIILLRSANLYVMYVKGAV